MKNKFCFILFSILLINAVSGQTVDIEYLNPKFTSNPDYKYLRFGTSSAHYAGLMWNFDNPGYGDGDDFSIFSYNNRDITIRTGTGNFIVFPNSGNGKMGIGTTSPANQLDLRLSGSYGYTARFAEANGAGIILGVNPNNDDPLSAYIGHTSSNRNIKYAVSGAGKHIFNTNADQSLIIHNSGNVGIGTTSIGSHKLAVEGSIGAREIKVEVGPNWSDFVFDHDYKLRSLEEVEQHISENGHLPEIPSKEEATENGINLGEMNAKLLQKIEELTLYLIEQNKELKTANQRIGQLEQKLSQLENK